MDLAWKNCARDVYAVVYMYIGMLIFIGAFFIFTLLNLTVNFNNMQVVQYVPSPDISGTTLANTIISAMIGFANAVYTLTFLAIVICLFEYALSFTTICYYYDNKSWAVPALFRGAILGVTNHIKSEREENSKSDRKHRIYLENEILKIRNNTQTDTKIE